MIIFLLLKEVQNYIVIKLKKVQKENYLETYSPEIFMDNAYNKYYTLLNIGTPSQLTEVQLNCDLVDLSFSEDICLTNNYFNKTKSISFNQTVIYEKNNPFVPLIFSDDCIKFLEHDPITNTFNETSVDKYTFVYKTENNDNFRKVIKNKACAEFGLKIMCPSNAYYCKSFLDVLKENNIINQKRFFFNYYSENKNGDDAEIIIGDYPYQYNKDKYNKFNVYKSRAELSDIMYLPDWGIKYQNYFYTSNGTKINLYLTKIKQYMEVKFIFDLENIIGIMEYFHEIKINYFNKYPNECQINEIKNQYIVITCNKDFNVENFPTLYFENIEANYTLELTYKDLFEIKGDKKYFLITFDTKNVVPWKFGKIFLQKYFFNFDAENKIIEYYKLNSNNNNKREGNEINSENKILHSTISVMIFVLVIMFSLILYFVIYKCKYENIRKKRANELDDDFDYAEKRNEKVINKDKIEKLVVN